MQLSSDIWVYALIRRVELAGAFAMLLRKGDARAGAVLVKALDRPNNQARLYTEARIEDRDEATTTDVFQERWWWSRRFNGKFMRRFGIHALTMTTIAGAQSSNVQIVGVKLSADYGANIPLGN